ncbi:MAG: leucine-rich repeat protein [Clostridia bacterium]|nr:leucine-rich repeat protein [Clostridia bacterium]
MNKVLRLILIMVLIAAAALTLAACSTGNGKLVSIEVDEDTIQDVYDVADFKVSNVYIILTYESEETERIPLTKTMIKAEDHVKLLVPGDHSITVTHMQRTMTFTLKLREDIAGKLKVIFRNEDGTQIGDIIYVEEGANISAPAAPTKADHDFADWRDQYGNFTALESIYEDKTFTATFESSFCTVKFILQSGVSILELDIRKGTNAAEVAPAFPVIAGKTATGWDLPLIDLFEDITYTAQYIDNTINVYYVFGDDGRAPKAVNYPASTMISPTDSPLVDHSEFLGWYTNNTFDGEMVTFPYLLQSEITFYAKYVSRTMGSPDLEYSYTGSNTYTVSGYNGDDDIIVIPEKYNNLDVVGIENRAFLNARNKSFSVTSTNNYFSITDGVLFDINKQKIFAYPAGKPNNQYTLPVGVKSIENYAFANAKNLMVINFLSQENLTSIGNYSFMNCSQLLEMLVPASVQKIGEGALLMEEDSALSRIVFPANAVLQQIGREAFKGLNKITTVTLPSTRLDSIGNSAFYGCTQLREILLEGGSSQNFSSLKGVLFDKTAKTLIAYPTNNVQNLSATYTVPEGVETIKAGAFINSGITGVSLPLTIKTIEGFAFNSPKLQFVQFAGATQPESLDSIMFGDFRPTFIVIPEGTQASYGFFENFQIIENDPPETYYFNSDTGYLYTKNLNDKLTLFGLRNQTAELVIPAQIDGFDIIGLGKYIFYNNKKIQNVVLSEGLRHIDEYAFWNAKTLQSITLPDSLYSIGKSAFSDCSSLATVIGSAEIMLDSIGEEAFLNTPWYDGVSEEFLVIGDALIKYNGTGSHADLTGKNIKIIADNAFIELSNLTKVTLNDGLKSIGSYAFYGCSGIFNITIPASVNYIGAYAFAYCNSLYRITVLAAMPPHLSELGEVFTTDSLYHSGSEEYSFSVLVPFHSSSFYLNAYRNNAQWSKYDIFHLIERSVSFDSGVGVPETSDTNTVLVPYQPPERAGFVFAGWFETESSIEQLDLDPVIFPYELDANKTFYGRWYPENEGTAGIEYTPINDGNEYAVFRYTGMQKYVVVPNEYKGKPVTCVSSGAFSAATSANNAEVYQILLPKTIRTIEKGALEDTLWYEQYLGDFVCVNDVLIEYKGINRYVVIPENIKYVVEGAFKGNITVTTVVFPNLIEELPAEVMMGCANLSEVILPAALKKISSKAFEGCAKLRQINFPQTVESISPDAFEGTAWLTNFVDDIVTVNNVLYRYKGRQSTLHIPNTINIIEKQAFLNNIYLENVYMPSTVATIGESAFEGCISLQKVQFPDGASIRYIMPRAFYGCLMMYDFNFGRNSSIQSIDEKAFAYCTTLSSVEFPASLNLLGKGAYEESGIVYAKFADRNQLPAILESTFANCRNLKTFVYGGSSYIARIDENAFLNCTNLMSVNIPASNNYLTKIDVRAFYNCTSLVNIILPSSLMEIGDDAFYAVPYVDSNNDVLMTVGSVLLKYTGSDSVVVISKEVAAISKGAFAGNQTLISVVFETGSRLFAIGEEAFMNCPRLENINFPETITHIGKDAFKNSKWLTNYADDFIIVNNILLGYKGDGYQAIIPGNVTTIGIDAFNGNTRLRNIAVGANVTRILARAFDNMSPTSTITMLGINPPLLDEDNAIPGIIYVETETIFNNYRENESWANFINDKNESVIIKYQIMFDLLYSGAYLEDTSILTNALFVEPVPTLQDYTFIGWYEVYNDGYSPEEPGAYESLISLPYLPSGNITLYAKWIYNHSGTIVGELSKETLNPVNAV